jgi:RNA polymerase sigma-70 factor, ECF subfamily
MSLIMTTAQPSQRAEASQPAGEVFERLAEPFRREIKLHCYRMLGSVHEAEDLVQETYLRAWRGFGSLEERGSIRAWLYRIATNTCLDALDCRGAGRLLPDQRQPAMVTAQMPDGAPPTDIAWLEPYPDTELERIADDTPGPEARYASREAVQLAFIAAIQELPPRQRVALLLCDVLGWSAAETATLLGGSIASVNSALQRARETLARRYPDGRPGVAPRPSPAQQTLLDRYLKAWEGHDLDGLVAVLKEDATFTMPPWQQWFVGRRLIGAFFAIAWKSCGGLRLVATSANGQPAFAVYEQRAADGTWAAHSIHVLTLEQDSISALTAFLDPRLLEAFGLPPTLPEDADGESRSSPHG